MIRHMLLLLTAAASGAGAAAQSGPKTASTAAPVRFIEDIEVGFSAASAPAKGSPAVIPAAPNTNPSTPAKSTNTPVPIPARNASDSPAVHIEDAGSLHLKFALLLNVEVERVPQLPVMVLIDDWWGTRYRLGGNDRNGIDCSGFTCMLYNNLFQTQLPRTAREQYQALRSIDPSELREGDLVFFTTGSTITHVGFYLQNNKFAHASTSEGVTISDLNDRYWQARFAGAGRLQ